MRRQGCPPAVFQVAPGGSFAADLAQTDLTAPQVGVLSLLAAANGQALSDLSRELHLSHSIASGIVDRLARKGLVERRVDAQDGRRARPSCACGKSLKAGLRGFAGRART